MIARQPKPSLDDFAREFLRGGTRRDIARRMGVSETTVYKKARQLGIEFCALEDHSFIEAMESLKDYCTDHNLAFRGVLCNLILDYLAERGVEIDIGPWDSISTK